jgi:hypothetical protein
MLPGVGLTATATFGDDESDDENVWTDWKDGYAHSYE